MRTQTHKSKYKNLLIQRCNAGTVAKPKQQSSTESIWLLLYRV